MSALIVITQIALVLLCAGGCLALYTLGARAGANAAAMLELYEQFPDLRPERPLTSVEKELREEYKARARDYIFQQWRTAYKLPDTSEVRALFSDADYRKALRGQDQ